MTCVIKDVTTGAYFTQRVTSKGWYHHDIGRARMFSAPKYAEKTIKIAAHHVMWPHNRNLVVIEIKIEEITHGPNPTRVSPV